MKHSTSLTFLGFLVAGLLGPVTPGHAAPPNVVIEQVQPDVGGKLVYLPLAPKTQDDLPTAQLSVDLYLRNQGNEPQTIQHVIVEFPDSNLAPIVRSAGLKMLCPPNAKAENAQTVPLVLKKNELCKVALLEPNEDLRLQDMELPVPVPAKATIRVFFASGPEPISVTRSLAAHVNSTATGSYRFPAKASDLPPGAFWSAQSSGVGSHHRMTTSSVFAYDMGLRRKGGGQWPDFWEPAPGEQEPKDTNDDFLVWGIPVYAMADGEVIDCKDGIDDNDVGVAGTTANSFTIRHGVEIAWYGHLKKDSIDKDICQKGKKVKEGQRLGQAGNSGISGAPHLHVHVTRSGFGVPLLFNDAFVLEQTDTFPDSPIENGPWAGLSAAGPPWKRPAIWPSGLRRRGERVGQGVEAFAMASSSASHKVTVARDLDDNLRVDLWEVLQSGELAHRASETGGGVDVPAAARPFGTDDMAVALRTASGNLKLIAYEVDGNSLERAQEVPEDPILGVAAATAPFPQGIVTAIRTGSGNLRVIAWKVDAKGKTITRIDHDDGGTTRAVAVSEAGIFPGVVVAVRTESDILRLIPFSVTPGGGVKRLVHHKDLDNIPIKDVSLTWIDTHNGRDRFVSAAERLDGKLDVTAWEVDAAGVIQRLGSAAGLGKATGVSVTRASNEHALTAFSSESGDLELIAWHIDDAGAVRRRAERNGGPTGVTALALAPLPGGPTLTVSAVRGGGSGSELKLINWQVLLTDD